MEKTSREKIALIVFLVLAIGAGFILFGYVIAGHSWNIISTNLDDTFGNMDGYTVISYEGTRDEQVEPGAASTAAGNAATSRQVTSDNAATGSTEPQIADGGSKGSSASAESADADEAKPQDGGVSLSTSQSSGASSSADASSAHATDSATASASAPLTGHRKEKEPVALSDVEALYAGKGACILSLDTADPGRYSEGVIVKRGGKRYGIFGLEAESSRILVDEKVKYLRDQAVDCVIAIVPEMSMLKGAEGIDIAITTDDADVTTMGGTKNGMFCVAAPDKGSIGAVLISPSNVVSAKTISEL